jgi:phospholipid-translocating ATPase
MSWWLRLGLPTSKPCRGKGPSDKTSSGFDWLPTKWKDARVGDIIRLERDEDIPADIVLLHATGENGLAYIETMALDGETNLKSKQVSTALETCDSIEGIAACSAELVVEDPNPDLYRFEGRVTVSGGKIMPLTLNEVIFRGCTLRNTPTAIGLVINTGEECKIRRNANHHPKAKKPALEKMANRIVISLVVYVILLSVGCSIGYLLWQRSTEQYAWYLKDAAVKFQEIIIGFAIQFNNIIPLALYVSLEIVKIGQVIMLSSDLEMYDEVSDTPAGCNTNTILENLGQIGYVFSDKTGTLTDNVMKFRKMSIAGTTWLHEMDLEAGDTGKSAPRPKSRDSSAAQPTSLIGRLSIAEERTSIASPRPTSSALVRRSSSHWRSTGRPDHVQPELNSSDLLGYIRERPESPFAKRAIRYLLAIALCHTCLPEIRDGKLEFQSASPDELALVQAARDLGFIVAQRSSQSVTLRLVEDGEERDVVYEILDVIEFSSKRKRMSIIVRCPGGKIWLISKGADSTILPRLKMAHLAFQKASEVRKSLELEQELQRKSGAREPRNSFGGRPSLTIRRSFGVPMPSPTAAIAGPSRPLTPTRTASYGEAKIRRSGDDRPQRPAIVTRTVSFDVPQRQPTQRSLLSPISRRQQPRWDKFAFLDEPDLCDDATIFARCFKHLDEFATEGLRTLLFAHRFLTDDEYRSWKKVFDEASTSLVDRQEQIETVGEMIEQELELIGASAIEDKLQKGVPETIDRLRRANIKIWMLTGDKRETAINIAHSARICQPESEMFILDVNKGDLEAQLLGIMEELQHMADAQSESASFLGSAPGHAVLVVDGHTLSAIEPQSDDGNTSTRLQTLFYNLIPSVDSVICCRASPAQKALLVRAVRDMTAARRSLFKRTRAGVKSVHTPLTLAIGDGANDLAMLAEAHVGVGISGKEGLQAARVADYSIAQFRFLGRMLLVHGRWNYARTARFVLATFWKEAFFYLPAVLYQRETGYTGTSIYESWSLTVLNTLFTSLCVVAPGIWEQDLSAETLLAVPELYVFGQRNGGLNMVKYFAWMFAAAAEGLLIWFACWAGYGVFGPVRDDGLFALGDLIFSVSIMWTNWKLM